MARDVRIVVLCDSNDGDLSAVASLVNVLRSMAPFLVDNMHISCTVDDAKAEPFLTAEGLLDMAVFDGLKAVE